jgi:branched-chain amino acid transport system permease protein
MSEMPAASVAAPIGEARLLRRLLGSARNRLLLVAGVVVLGMIFFVADDSWLSVFNTVMVYSIATLALNVLSGYAGQVSLGIAFFMGIGAYTAAWLGGSSSVIPGFTYSGLNLPFILWLPAAGVVAALLGALLGPTALRLKGFYLGIITLALIFIGTYLFNNLRAITGGPPGRAVPSPGFGNFSFSDYSSPNPIFGLLVDKEQLWFLLLLVVLGLVGLFVANVARSRAGRAWQAVRDNEVAASIMGVNLFTAKMGAFILSSFLAGIAGALLASYTAYSAPTNWNLVLSIQLIAAMLIGGAASVWGSILGTAFVFALPLVLSNLSQSASTSSNDFQLFASNLNQILYGLLIIAFLLFEPAGLIGLFRRLQVLARRLEARRKGSEGGEADQTLAASAAAAQLDVEVSELPHGSA